MCAVNCKECNQLCALQYSDPFDIPQPHRPVHSRPSHSRELGTPPQLLLLMVAPASLHSRRHSRASDTEPMPSSQMNLQTSSLTSMATPVPPRLHNRAGRPHGMQSQAHARRRLCWKQACSTMHSRGMMRGLPVVAGGGDDAGCVGAMAVGVVKVLVLGGAWRGGRLVEGLQQGREQGFLTLELFRAMPAVQPVFRMLFVDAEGAAAENAPGSRKPSLYSPCGCT